MDRDFVLEPGGTFLFVWELLIILVSVLNILYIPMEVCFQLEKRNYAATNVMFSLIPSYVFMLDMIFNFFKAYFKDGIYCDGKSDIFWHYVKGNWILDLFVIFPFMIEQFGLRYTNFFMLLRITRIKRTFDTIEQIFNF